MPKRLLTSEDVSRWLSSLLVVLRTHLEPSDISLAEHAPGTDAPQVRGSQLNTGAWQVYPVNRGVMTIAVGADGWTSTAPMSQAGLAESGRARPRWSVVIPDAPSA